MPPYRQDLSKAVGGKLTGRGGKEQTLGAAAQRRIGALKPTAPATPAPAPKPQPAWQALAAQGIGGQGSRAANMARLAGTEGSSPNTQIAPVVPGSNVNAYLDSERAARTMAERNANAASGGGMAKPNFGGVSRGMASFLRPPVGGPPMDSPMEQAGGAEDAQILPGEMTAGPPAGPLAAAVTNAANRMPGGGQVPAMAKPNFGGVNSNAFAANGGTPSGAPLQPGGGQAARIQALLARLRGSGGGTGLQPMAQQALY